MMKRFVALGLIILLVITAIPVLAENMYNYTWAEGWDVGTYSYVTEKGTHAFVTTEQAHEGTYSMKIRNKEKDLTRVWTKITGLEPGKTYTASVYVKIIGALPEGAGALLRVTADYKDGAGKAWKASERISGTQKRWKELTAKFTVPAGMTEAAVCLDTGNVTDDNFVYWDSLTVEGVEVTNGSFESIIEIKPEVIEVPEGAENLIENGGFEAVDGVAAVGWNAYKDWKDNPYVSVTTEKAHSGSRSIKLTNDGTGTNPWVNIKVQVEPGVDYLITMWVWCEKLPSGKDTRIKFEPYSDPVEFTAKTALDGSFNSAPVTNTFGEWMKIQQKFSSSVECQGVAIYPRLYSGSGACYYDDVEMYKITEPRKIFATTNWGIYYPDFEEGYATVTPYTGFETGETTVGFEFLDGDKVLLSQEARPFQDGQVQFFYPVSLLSELTKEYVVRATLYDIDGNVLESMDCPIYKYERSPYLREDGVFLKNKTEPFYPVLAYHAYGKEHFPYLAEGGINAIQVHFTSIGELDSIMKNVVEYNVMAMIALYRGGGFAGDPENQEMNAEAITKYKDHPNVMGWMIQDEPFNKGEYFDVLKRLRESYTFIKRYDPEHPVYCLDASVGTFVQTAKWVDILTTDPYPTSKRDPATFVATRCAALREATQGEKPGWSVVQAYEGGIWPTGDQYRSSLYQSLFGGAKGLGLYAVSDARYIDGVKTELYKTDLWPALKEFAEVDFQMANEVFVSAEIPTFNEVRGEKYWYRSWEKDGKLYLIILNRDNNNETEAEIQLTSFDGSVTVGGFSGKIIAGGEGEASGNGVLKAKLQPCAAQLWELELSTPVDFSVSAPYTYFDMDAYGWARSAAELMKEKGITYDPVSYNFRPGEKITRGDLAMFLVRSLGLTGTETESFDDVPADAHYAKELAIGKAAGILNGVGDNKFNPQAEITRQDMMTIISRGMALTGETDLAAFSDSSLIADYALSHVKAMISSGLVKGNADGTLNPLGNTTRAEAAVIMQRILKR
ncbi:MAG: hypothetical protein E7390_07125 [Ruminococcaceae bacterium]|nr:hypothetical protein [Oscillospiraceae bacterium]